MLNNIEYVITTRNRPEAIRPHKWYLRVGGRAIGIGPRKDYVRPWVLLRWGKPIGYYETKAEALAALPEWIEVYHDDSSS